MIKKYRQFNESAGSIESQWSNAGLSAEEIKYRKMLLDLADKSDLEDIGIEISFDEFKKICRDCGIRTDMNPYRSARCIKFSYYTDGWLDYNDENSTQDAVTLSIPEFNNYGYAGETHAIDYGIPAKYFYEYLTRNYEFKGGEWKPKDTAAKRGGIRGAASRKAVARDAMNQVFRGGLDPTDLNPEELDAIGSWLHI